MLRCVCTLLMAPARPHRVRARQKERLPADWAGAEWWCQVRCVAWLLQSITNSQAARPLPYKVYQRSRGLAFHWDKDEKELLATGEMVHPALSTVIYLNTASECAPVPLGATLVMQQHFDAVAGCGVPEPSRRDVLVWPSHNALLVFDGALAHGVLDSPSPHVRRTLLVNWWSKQPRSVARASAADAEKHALAPPLPGIAAAPPASRVRIPVCELRAATDCVEGPAALMAVLEQHGCGPAATPAVAVHHPDTVVWQVEGAEDEPLPEVADAPDAAAAYAPLIAAVIPDELAANLDSGSESSSGTDADQ